MSGYKITPFQNMDGEVMIYLASRHLTGHPNSLYAFAWDGNTPSLLCLVSCASKSLSARSRLSGFCGETLFIFRRKAQLSLTKDAAVARQLFEHIDTEIGHALLQPTVDELLIAYTRSWSFYNASEYRIPQGRHVIAATYAATRKRKIE
jgi:hypothetical protein